MRSGGPIKAVESFKHIVGPLKSAVKTQSHSKNPGNTVGRDLQERFGPKITLHHPRNFLGPINTLRDRQEHVLPESQKSLHGHLRTSWGTP